MASTLSVRIFELVCLSLWLGGLVWVRRVDNPVYRGVYTGSAGLILFDWVFNSNWFFRVEFDSKFIDLFRIQGVSEPLAMALNYAFYFGAPVLLLVHHRAWLDRRFGRRGYLVVFLLGAAALPVFEIPMVRWFKLWTYYQSDGYLWGGVPWSNIWYSGLLTVSCYAAARLALRWAAIRVAVPAGDGLVIEPAATREDNWRGFALGAASVWTAFYLSMSAQLIWYALTQPWTDGPRPF